MHTFSLFILTALDSWDNLLFKVFDQENSLTGAKKLKQLKNQLKPTKVSTQQLYVFMQILLAHNKHLISVLHYVCHSFLKEL